MKKNIIKFFLLLSVVFWPSFCFANQMDEDILLLKGDINKINEYQENNFNRLNLIENKIIPNIENNLNNYNFEKESIKNLIQSVAVKQQVVDEKEKAYDKAINEMKLWFSGFSVVALAILTILGIWRNKTLQSASKKIEEKMETEIANTNKRLDSDFASRQNLFDSETIKKFSEFEKLILQAAKVNESENRKRIDVIEDRLFRVLNNQKYAGSFSGKLKDDNLDNPDSIDGSDNIAKKDIDPFA